MFAPTKNIFYKDIRGKRKKKKKRREKEIEMEGIILYFIISLQTSRTRFIHIKVELLNGGFMIISNQINANTRR